MIPTKNHSPRGAARVRLIVLHTTEGARTVESLGGFFQRATDVSYHAAFDDHRSETFVDYSRAAWAIQSGNWISDNAAFCAFAAWTRAEWLRHPRMLDLAAAWVAQRCLARRIPIHRLSLVETADAVRDRHHPGGVIMHRDYTLATRQGTHTDCGDGLPWDVLLTRAQQIGRSGGAGAVAVRRPPIVRSRRRDPGMELPATKTRLDKQLPTDDVGGWCGAANLLLTANTGGATVYGVYAVVHRGDATPPDVRPLLKDDKGRDFMQWWSMKAALPAGTTSVVVNYTADQGMVARIEYEH